MDQILTEVEGVLKRSFPGVQLELELTRSERVGGALIWDGFLGLDQMDRQQRLWGVLKQSLDTQTERRVGTILTLTPWEVQEMEEVAAA